MKSVKSLLIEIVLKELFQQFVTLIFIHLSRDINLSGINVILGKFSVELGNDLFGDLIVKLLDFVKLIHCYFYSELKW